MSERIERAAILLADGRVFDAPRPGRHHTIINEILPASGASGRDIEEQGFVTSTGAFVRRKPAWRIAERAGQLLERAPTGPRGTLFSEDVW